MQALRLNDVLSRVVAWHNRHPLARRIQASQVHSIGEVRLPFASARPLGAAPMPAPAADTDLASAHAAAVVSALLADSAEAPPTPAAAAPADPPAATPEPPAAGAAPALDIDLFDSPAAPPPAATPPAGQNDDDEDGEAALVMPVLDADGTLKALPDDDAPTADGAAPGDASGPTADPDDRAADEPPTEREPATEADAAPADPFDLPELRDDAPPATAPAELADSTAPVPGEAGALPDAALADPGRAPADGHPVPSDGGAPPPSAETVAPVSALRRRAEAAAGGAAVPLPTAAAAAVASPAAPQPAWRRWVAALQTALTGRRPGMPALRAAFSRDFIWPLKPAQVARWAQRHAETQPLAPADWPRRQVETDAQLLSAARQQGLAHTVQLHVLTAAIGVGDRRIRVLIDAQGAVIGPRAYSRARVGTAATLVAVMLAGGGWTLRPVVDPDLDAAALAALPASAAASAAAPASAVAGAEVAASGVADAAASASLVADAASATESAAHGAPPPDAAAAEAAASAAPAHGGEAPAVATAGDAAASAPPPSIRPVIPDEERHLARAQGQQLRGETPSPPPAPVAAEPAVVYAVVTRPSRQREAAASGLALMRAAGGRLPPPVPEHGELMLSQGEWRAAWWPFASLADAERARVLLAGRGLKADVVEF